MDFENRYQKFRFESTGHGGYIRFDDHPQPGIRLTDLEADGNRRLELYDVSRDPLAKWIVTGIQDSGEFPTMGNSVDL